MTVHAPISKYPEVDQADVRGELAEIYDDIEFTLCIPWVPFAIRVMSLFPAFVPAVWQMVKPQISAVYAEKGADLVRKASIVPGRRLHTHDPGCAPPGGPMRRSARFAGRSIRSTTAIPRA